MPTPNSSRTLTVSLLGVLALAAIAAAQRPGGGRPSGGGGGGISVGGGGGRPSGGGGGISMGGGSRPSGGSMSGPSMSRPSMPSASRPSAASYSRPAASPSYQRGSASPAPSAQPRSQPAPQPRYEQPAAPHSSPSAQPRYEQPSAPRYEPSAPRSQPSAPRYEQPGTGRSDAPSGRSAGGASAPPHYGSSRTDAGRVYDGGPSSGRLGGSSSRGDYRGAQPSDDGGRIEPARIDRSTPTPYQPRVWQPAPVVDLSGAIRQPRVGVPSISGSRSGPDGGLAAGRLARAGLDGARASAAVPHPEVSADSLRARYGAAEGSRNGARVPGADARVDSGSRGRGATGRSGATPPAGSGVRDGNGLSSGRQRAAGRSAAPGSTPAAGDASSRTRGQATRTIDGDPGRGSGKSGGNDFDRRAAAARRQAAAIDAADPVQGARLRAAVDAAYRAGTVATGTVAGTCTGYYTGDCWDTCDDAWNDCGWYWNSCWYGGWWWGWGFGFGWGWGSCWWGYPYYGGCWPWGYGCSYWGWGWSPYAYTTVIYESQPEVVVEAPAPEPEVGVPAPGAVPQVAPEVRAGLEASADEALVAGDTAFREGRYSDAVRHYARAVEFSPERGSLWLILSDALFATGDYHYAAYAFRKALDLDATLLETLVDKHGWYSDPAEFDRHIAWAEAYLRDHVLDEDARLILAANYLFAKRFASATDALESAFGAGILDTPAGKLVLERSRRALGIVVK